MVKEKTELLNKKSIKTINKLMETTSETNNPMTIKQLKVILKIQNYTGHKFKGVSSKDAARDFISAYIDESYKKEEEKQNEVK